jgi:hypothetical protein
MEYIESCRQGSFSLFRAQSETYVRTLLQTQPKCAAKLQIPISEEVKQPRSSVGSGGGFASLSLCIIRSLLDET